MKKIFACLLIMVITLCSCSQKKAVKVYSPDKNFQQYIFTQIQKGNVPSGFKEIFKRPVWKGRSVFYLFEYYYPECIGLFDSTGFYSGECDNASWVDFLLFSMEEMRYGQEVLELLEGDDVAQPAQPVEPETENAEAVEKNLIDSYGRLRILEFGKERLIPQKLTGSDVLIHFSDNKAVRYFYDDTLRLVKKEYWKMESVQDSGLTSYETYEYNEQSRNPVKKIIQNEKARIVSFYDENGLVIKAEKYLKEKTADDKEKQIISNRTEWKYDEKNRITLESSLDYIYDKNGKLKNKSEKKQFFYYNKADELGENEKLPPDYELYEDGILKIQTKYKSKGEYTNMIVFEPGSSVTTYYENYAKIKDVYILNGTEKRVKYYE